MQQRRQQQHLTCNTPSFEAYSQCFITDFVLTGKKQGTLFLKKRVFFCQSLHYLFQVWVSFKLLIMLLNNLPISLDGRLNCICTQVSIKVETYYILLNPKLKIKFYTRQNPKWFEKYITKCILSFFSVP